MARNASRFLNFKDALGGDAIPLQNGLPAYVQFACQCRHSTSFCAGETNYGVVRFLAHAAWIALLYYAVKRFLS
jgi:hypothetical protein